jgi:DNA ligase (NAD+)
MIKQTRIENSFWVVVRIFFALICGLVHGSEAEHTQLLELRREIARHDELYFRKAAPVISDAEYDALKIKLKELEERTGESVDGVAVGDDRTGDYAAYRHREPMQSLAKAYSDEEVAAFVARVEAKLGRGDVQLRVEPKYDGLAVSLTYERGQLVRAVTRGDGVAGDDLTANVRQRVSGIVERLVAEGEEWSGPEVMELRGEIFMTLADFKRVNTARAAAGEDELNHPRNAAVGLLRAQDAEAAKDLSLVCYGWGAWSPTATRPATLTDFRRQLIEWRLPVVAADRMATGVADLQKSVMDVRAIGAKQGVPTDGVVIKVERTVDQEELGLAPGAPHWAVARKFAPEQSATQLLGVTWQVGRSGAVTPVAELAPLTISGSKVARASLHNAGEIARKDLRIGDWVWVVKAGEIIPAITGVDLGKRTGVEVVCVVPENCPACKSRLKREIDVAVLLCGNRGCPAQIVRRLAQFASPAAMDIRGVGPAALEAAVASGLMRGPADFYRMKATEWAGLPGMGARTAEKVIAAVAASRTTARTDGARLIYGLGFPGVGMRTAKRLVQAMPSFEHLVRADESSFRRDADMGETAARELHDYLRRDDVAAELAALSALGMGGKWDEAEKSGGIFQGQIVVVTGTLTRWTRAEVASRLIEAGATVANEVSSKTTCVVAGAEAGAKLKRARELGVEVIDEEELVKRLR